MLLFVVLSIADEQTKSFMEGLYWKYRKLVFSQVLQIFPDSWAAEDIVQTVFVSLVEKAELLQTLERNRLVNYIITTTKNATYFYLRGEKRKNIISFDETYCYLAEELISPDKADYALLKEATSEELHHAWSRLDEKTQWLLAAHYFEGHTNEHIAEKLEIKPDSVRMLLSRARHKLKKELQSINFEM